MFIEHEAFIVTYPWPLLHWKKLRADKKVLARKIERMNLMLLRCPMLIQIQRAFDLDCIGRKMKGIDKLITHNDYISLFLLNFRLLIDVKRITS